MSSHASSVTVASWQPPDDRPADARLADERGRSQLDLSIDVGVSTRHLSFVETGRSRPSPELVLAVAEHLDVPLRERNTMLLAAGFAPRYSARELADVAMRRISDSLQRMLDLHDPYPGVVIDRRWNVLLSEDAATALTAGLPDHVLAPTPNVFRMCLHPDGLAAATVNFDEWAMYLLRQLRRTILLTGDEGLIALEAEVHAYPNVARIVRRAATDGGDERRSSCRSYCPRTAASCRSSPR